MAPIPFQEIAVRVKMLNSRVGVNETFNGGSEYDLPEARALRWIDAGFAVPADEIAVVIDAPENAAVAPAVEAAIVVAPVEAAVKRGRRK